jgi:hypothetical protein
MQFQVKKYGNFKYLTDLSIISTQISKINLKQMGPVGGRFIANTDIIVSASVAGPIIQGNLR